MEKNDSIHRKIGLTTDITKYAIENALLPSLSNSSNTSWQLILVRFSLA